MDTAAVDTAVVAADGIWAVVAADGSWAAEVVDSEAVDGNLVEAAEVADTVEDTVAAVEVRHFYHIFSYRKFCYIIMTELGEITFEKQINLDKSFLKEES